MVQHPRLAGLLGPHFTPTVAATPVFLVMYKSVVNVSVQPNSDLSFVLLSKVIKSTYSYSYIFDFED